MGVERLDQWFDARQQLDDELLRLLCTDEAGKSEPASVLLGRIFVERWQGESFFRSRFIRAPFWIVPICARSIRADSAFVSAHSQAQQNQYQF